MTSKETESVIQVSQQGRARRGGLTCELYQTCEPRVGALLREAGDTTSGNGDPRFYRHGADTARPSLVENTGFVFIEEFVLEESLPFLFLKLHQNTGLERSASV